MSEATPSPADAGSARALLVLQGSSRVRPLTYAEALMDARYRRWAASALAARIAGVDDAADAVGAKQVRGVLLEAWIEPGDLPAGSLPPDLAAAVPGQPPLRGRILDRGTRIEIPDRGPDGQRQSPVLAPALVALATRLAVLKGWTHVLPMSGPGVDPIRATTADAMVRLAARQLVRHGIDAQGASAGRPGNGPEAAAAAWWKKPHWLRADIDDDERRARLGELEGAKAAAGQEAPPKGRPAGATPSQGGLDLLRTAPGAVEPPEDDAPRLLL